MNVGQYKNTRENAEGVRERNLAGIDRVSRSKALYFFLSSRIRSIDDPLINQLPISFFNPTLLPTNQLHAGISRKPQECKKSSVVAWPSSNRAIFRQIIRHKTFFFLLLSLQRAMRACVLKYSVYTSHFFAVFAKQQTAALGGFSCQTNRASNRGGIDWPVNFQFSLFLFSRRKITSKPRRRCHRLKILPTAAKVAKKGLSHRSMLPRTRHVLHVALKIDCRWRCIITQN